MQMVACTILAGNNWLRCEFYYEFEFCVFFNRSLYDVCTRFIIISPPPLYTLLLSTTRLTEVNEVQATGDDVLTAREM